MARSQSLRSILILLAVSLFIAACGGGGGGSTDRTPNAFSFTASSEAELAEQVESGTITVAGIEAAVDISISGGEYSINDGAYTSTAGTVSQGQTVKVRLTASSEFATAATSTVTIGGVRGSFSATTIAQDTTPEDLLDFPNKTLQGLGLVVVSDPITVLGINDAAEVTISDGGEYAIDSGDFTSDEGQITSGQTITVRLTASSSFSTPAVVTLTVGGEESEFTATTLLQDTTPETLADFAPKVTQGLGAQVISDPITISNINDAATISVSAGGEYSINGGAFTSDSGQVSSGQTVVIRLTASSAFSTPTVVTLTVGGVESEFTATTLLQDTTPETLSNFISVDARALAALVISEAITISNINDAANVTITGGSYSIGSGGFTASAGQISSGQSIRVQVTTSELFDTPATVTLTVGGVEASFTATTLLQDTLPETLVDFSSAVTQELEALVNSDSVIITNINDAADVTVVGGAYSIGAGDFTTSAGQISSGESIRVQVTTSELFDTPATVTITVGGVAASFTATTVVQDVEPAGFTIMPKVDQVAGDLVISDSFTVEGVNDAIAISVDGGASFSINDLAFGSDPSTVVVGDEVRVQLSASSDSFGVAKATLTLGDETTNESAIFSVRTALTFASSNNQLLGALDVASTTIVAITEFDAPQDISVTNGEFSVDGGTIFQASGTVSNGQNLIVRTEASGAVSTSVIVDIDIGAGENTLNGTYTVTTVADNIIPTVSIQFPPPASMTEGVAVTVRGIAADDSSGIASIDLEVNGTPVDVTLEAGKWSVSVPLDAGENTISVVVLDNAGNASIESSVAVRRDDALGDFPDSNNLLDFPSSITLDAQRNRLLIGDLASKSIITVDLTTGIREVFSDNSIGDVATPLNNITAMLVDAENDLVWITDSTREAVFHLSLLDGTRTLFSNDAVPGPEFGFRSPSDFIINPRNSQEFLICNDIEGIKIMNTETGARSVFSSGNLTPPVPDPATGPDFLFARAITFDSLNDRALVLSFTFSAVQIIAVDLDSGARTMFSDAITHPDDLVIAEEVFSLELDPERDRVLISGSETSRGIYALELSTGSRSVFTGPSTGGGINLPTVPEALFYDGTTEYAFWLDSGLDAVLAVDIETGERVFITRGDSVD